VPGLPARPTKSGRDVRPYHPDVVASVTDEALIAALAAGDAEAATALVRRFQARVFGLASTMTGDASAAEEIAQETFVRVWRHAAAYDARRGRVSTWLLSITRNLAIDHLRGRRAEPIDPGDAAARERALWTAMRAADDVEQISDLRDELAALPDEQRRALLLASLFGYTAAEISAIDGIPLGTAKTRIRAAMMKLRDLEEAR
jgi:RNA polymerase sigma factor (sigma-70 family)